MAISGSVAFIYDHFFVNKNLKLYSTGSFSSASWDRFRPAFSRINVIARERRGFDGRLVDASSRDVFFFPLHGQSFFSIFGIYLIRNVFVIVKVIRASEHVVLRVPSFISLLAYFLCVLLRKNYSVEVVGNAAEAISGKRGRYFSYVFDVMTRRIVNGAVSALYVTSNYLQKIYSFNGFQGVASNVSINFSENALELRARQLSSMFSGAEVELRVGLVGSLDAGYKGIDDAIRAIALVKHELGRKIFLEVVGGGGSEKFMGLARSLLVADSVRFLGFLPREELDAWYRDIHVYIQPSLTEGLPRSLIESMSQACPAIASAVGGVPELLDSTWMHEPGDYIELSNLLLRMLRSRQLMQDASRCNHQASLAFDASLLMNSRSSFYVRTRTISLSGAK